MSLRATEILVVDDSTTIRRMLAREFQALGASVSEARHGVEGVAMAQARPYDLVICDCEMPWLDGFDLCRRLKSDPATNPIPVILIGSSASDIAPSIQAGACDCVIKSRYKQELLPLATRILAHAKAAPDRRPPRDRRTIISLINTLEARESYARGHSVSVAKLSRDMGRILGVAPHALKQLEFAARLHDIGKIGIGGDILHKPGKLGRDDFAIVMRHPPAGASLLKSFTDAPEVLGAVLHHHERMDGSGYPHGLKGESIPLWARIIAVADVHHALTSDRPFRAALAPPAALDVIRQSSGDGLCPRCVDALLTTLEQRPGGTAGIVSDARGPGGTRQDTSAGQSDRMAMASNAPRAEDAQEPHSAPGQDGPNPDGNGVTAAFRLYDAFGRGLLLPLERYVAIQDVEIEPPPDRRVFPRRLCSSALLAIRTYLVGVEKYDMINEGLIGIITGQKQKAAAMDRDQISECYLQPKIARFLSGYYILLLKHLTVASTKAQFLYRVNCDIVNKENGEAGSFDQHYLSILTDSWARSVLDNIEHIKVQDAVLKVLFHFLPEQVAAFIQFRQGATGGALAER